MRRLFFMLCTAALGLAAAGLNASSQVIFATEGDYPPWNSRNDGGELEGFDVDYVAAICNALGEECEIESARFPGMMDALAQGRFDAIISGIAITQERLAKIEFTRPYMQLSVSFATSSSSPLAKEQPRTEAELVARLGSARIGAQADTVNARLAELVLPEANLVTFDNQEALNAAVAEGQVDAGVAATPAWDDPQPFEASALVVVGPRFTSAAYPVLGQGLGIGVAKANRTLKPALDRAICGLSANGTAAALSRKWFGDDLSIPCK